MTDSSPFPAAGISIAASEAEREACFALRYRVYVDEQGRNVPAADHERRLDRTADDASGSIFCAWNAGALVGTARVHHGAVTGIPAFIRAACGLTEDQTQVAAVSRLAIAAEHRGGTTIVALLRACRAWLSADGRDTRQIYILAFDEPKLIAMYRLLGFRPIEPVTRCMIDLGATIPMVSTL